MKLPIGLGDRLDPEQVVLAAFSMIRDFSQEPLAKALNAYVMQDEARHVAFGRLALREYYPQLTEAERGEREEFVVYASYLHARATAGWRGSRAAVINSVGFAVMVFNLFFINLVVAGLHSYAGVNG